MAITINIDGEIILTPNAAAVTAFLDRLPPCRHFHIGRFDDEIFIIELAKSTQHSFFTVRAATFSSRLLGELVLDRGFEGINNAYYKNENGDFVLQFFTISAPLSSEVVAASHCPLLIN